MRCDLLQILDAKAGFLVNGFMTVSATVLVLEESVQFTRDTEGASTSESLRCVLQCLLVHPSDLCMHLHTQCRVNRQLVIYILIDGMQQV